MSDKVEDFLYTLGVVVDVPELKHYGVKGMKWGKTTAKKDEPTSGGGGSDEPSKENVLPTVKVSESEIEIKIPTLPIKHLRADLDKVLVNLTNNANNTKSKVVSKLRKIEIDVFVSKCFDKLLKK